MTRPNWRAFVAIALIATVAILVLSRASARALQVDHGAADDSMGSALPSGGALLVNVAFTHGLLGAGLIGLVWWSGVPARALGVGSFEPGDLLAGLALGVGLYLTSEAATALAGRAGFAPDERLRALLAPDRATEWALLLFVVLPVIATTEELLFRGILIGGLATGFDVAPQVLVVASSALFGLGHSAQGGLGVLVIAVLGIVLGTAYVATGSLIVVVVAHYAVDVLEFVVREGLLD